METPNGTSSRVWFTGYDHIEGIKRTKLEPKRFRCMFLGYAKNVKGYRLFDMETSEVKISRSVKLEEREVRGIYDTQSPKIQTVSRVTRERDDEGVYPPESAIWLWMSPWNLPRNLSRM